MSTSKYTEKETSPSQYTPQKITSLKLQALSIDKFGVASQIEVDLSLLRTLLLVQPGVTPPSKVKDLPKGFKECGAAGCTGAAKDISVLCTQSAQPGYILSGKSLDDLRLANEENEANAKKEGKPNHPFANLIFISDPKFELAAALQDNRTQEISGQKFYKRFAVSLDRGTVGHITEQNIADTTKNVFITANARAKL